VNESCFMDMSVDCCLTLIMSILCFDGNKSEFPKIEESDYRVKTYNLNKKTIIRNEFPEECRHKISFFVVYESGKSIMLDFLPKDALNPPLPWESYLHGSDWFLR
ncbi:hypothetical protein, partial [Solemya velum gill symbiont]|uniref:hypothetical protein n=1 Tax=Solemya velum gill symbiont TaxID=2340 RepID=UPI001C4DDAA3